MEECEVTHDAAGDMYDYDKYDVLTSVGDTIVFGARSGSRFNVYRGVVEKFHESGKVSVRVVDEANPAGYVHVINGLGWAVKV